MPPLLRMLEKNPERQMKFAEPVSAECGIRDAIHNQRCVIVGDYFIMFDVASTWYSQRNFLIEDLILRVSRDTNNPVEDAIATLESLGRRFKCVAVVAGDTQVGHMSPKYLAAGYQVLGTQFIKEINYGVLA